MDLQWRNGDSEARFGADVDALSGVMGHADRVEPFRSYCTSLLLLRTRLGRLIRDIRRKTAGEAALREIFAVPLSRADQVRRRRQRQRELKLYSLHAPEVECIGKGKACAPYEFGCKISVVTPVTQPEGSQFVLHAAALRGNPYDGHTLGPVVAAMEKLTGVGVRRIHVDKGYRGHSYPNKFGVRISGQARRVTKTVRRETRRRATVEPVIGHMKAGHRIDRNYLKGRGGDRINAVLAAAGYNFSLLLRWFEALFARRDRGNPQSRGHSLNRVKIGRRGFFTDDLPGSTATGASPATSSGTFVPSSPSSVSP